MFCLSKIQFKLNHYGEFYTLTSNILKPDAKGECKITPLTGYFGCEARYKLGPVPMDYPYLG